jgi:hypothetical protein
MKAAGAIVVIVLMLGIFGIGIVGYVRFVRWQNDDMKKRLSPAAAHATWWGVGSGWMVGFIGAGVGFAIGRFGGEVVGALFGCALGWGIGIPWAGRVQRQAREAREADSTKV